MVEKSEVIGRSTDLDQMLRGLESGDGTTTAVVVTGAAGLGKTRLLTEIRQVLTARGTPVLVVAGSASAPEVPLGAFAFALPEPDEPAAGDPPTIRLIRRLGQEYADGVLLVDDVDRLDRASLVIVGQLLHRGRPQLILTARRFADLPPMVTRHYDAGRCVAHPLRPLTGDQTRQLAEDTIGGPITPDALALLAAHTAGNPLHIRELLHWSRRGGALVRTDHGWDFHGRPEPGQRLTDLIGAVFDNLPPADQQILETIALAGLLPTAAFAEQTVDRLERRGLVAVVGADDEQIRLAHPLHAEVLRGRIGPDRARRLNRRAVRLLEPAGDQRHLWYRRMLLLADLGEPLCADDVVRAGELALTGDDPRQALAFVAALDPAAEPSSQVWRIRGAAYSALGRVTEADQALRTALDRADRRDCGQAGAAARALAAHLATRRMDPGAAVAVLAGQVADCADPAERSRLEHDLVRWGMVAGLTVMLPPLPAAADEETYRHALVMRLLASAITGPLPQAVGYREQAAQAGVDGASTTGQLVRLADIMLACYDGRVADGLAYARRLTAPAAAHGGTGSASSGSTELASSGGGQVAELTGSWEFTAGIITMLAADLRDAHRLAGAAIRHLRWRDPIAMLPAALALRAATSAALRSDAEEAAARAALPASAVADPKVTMLLTWADARREQAAGEHKAAAARLAAAARSLLDVHHVFLAGMLGHCAARLGHPDLVVDLLDEAQAAGQAGVLTRFAAHARAVRDRDRDALGGLVGVFHRQGMITSAVDAATMLADWAGQDGNVTARDGWLLQAGRIAADATRLALWQQIPRGRPILTERERQVAELAARRHTVREIAQELGTSPSTIGNQLNAVYRKLAVGSRAELAAALARLTADPTAH
ncbi:LuxR C-terminal-related transcriptional regulator [Micromonospora sp. NBC_01813]|uniref:LuxR C-terminal-related transcriptional regulator n=1 Tax=Micromonospora sp. NBC_01813 TaxID=2975988 RepID=UPI002DD81D56|nr:LuxR C-terminal-related transcriptional regulator [Micromonospora sp. NBC_01813]WSA08690.1 LuxR C-terminal-related transcriptional regulator [Micromonospora sp. NBC_01813]